MTLEQFNDIKTGDVLIMSSGKARPVVGSKLIMVRRSGRKRNQIRLAKITQSWYPTKTTVYLYNDLKNKISFIFKFKRTK